MGSSLPIYFAGDRTVAAGNITTADFPRTPLLVPKLEPKSEPIDELPSDFSPNPSFSSDRRRKLPQSEQQSSQLIDPARCTEISISHGVQKRYCMAVRREIQKNGDSGVLWDILQQMHADDCSQTDSDVASSSSRGIIDKRSSELVRASDLNDEMDRCFHRLMRTTRMTYDSLLIFLFAVEDMRGRLGLDQSVRYRGDLKAAKLMRENGLWENRHKRIIGSIPGVQVGDVFLYRMELCVLGLHGPVQAGIDYVPSSQSMNGEPIATSIVISGGYEDDEDSDNTIIYTGQGGQAYNQHSQITHQTLKGGNLALERSMVYGIEIRVIRGIKYERSSTGKLYVYDGLYRIVKTWFDVGISGFGIYKYRLERMGNQSVTGSSILRFAEILRNALHDGYISLDISNGIENQPVSLFNDVDNNREPIHHTYIPTTLFPVFPHSKHGCDCVIDCSDDCICCLKNEGELAYDKNGILIRGKPVIFECGPSCKCSVNCRNRVTQRGLKKRFEVFRTADRRWGVRCLDLIQSGSFICEYAGVALTMNQARVFSVTEEMLIYSNQFGDRWSEWGDLLPVFSNYVTPKYQFAKPLSEFALHVKGRRNFAFYIRHDDSTPNVMVQKVVYGLETLEPPHLMLFATQNIPPLRELGLDYGVGNGTKDSNLVVS